MGGKTGLASSEGVTEISEVESLMVSVVRSASDPGSSPFSGVIDRPEEDIPPPLLEVKFVTLVRFVTEERLVTLVLLVLLLEPRGTRIAGKAEK